MYVPAETAIISLFNISVHRNLKLTMKIEVVFVGNLLTSKQFSLENKKKIDY